MRTIRALCILLSLGTDRFTRVLQGYLTGCADKATFKNMETRITWNRSK